MALFQCNFSARSLGVDVSVNVILPQEGNWRNGIPRRPLKTLYLLHGRGDDHTAWMRQTSIERHAQRYSLAVVMPAVNRSYYADMASGPAYWTYISEELPELMRAWFPLSAAREDNYVAGLSMGGYGAFKLALNHPERYAAAASLSGALNIIQKDLSLDFDPDWEHIFGAAATPQGTIADIHHVAKSVAALPASDQPRLYQWCGTEDFLYADNLRFRDHATALGLNLLYEEGPGDHTWGYWDWGIERVLRWLNLPAAIPVT
jgi:S-formylglutathione hydrolase FrmB